MPTREMQRFALILTASFAVALVAAAALFSVVFNGGGPRSSQSSSPEDQARIAELCRDYQARQQQGQPRQVEEELTELQPEQEDLLNTDGALAPAEVLGLNEGLDALENVIKTEPKTPPRTPAAAPKLEAEPGNAAGTDNPVLPPPDRLSPTRKVDLRNRPYVRFHWNSVEGAETYELKAWQMHNGKKVVLLDVRTPETEVRAEPRHDGPVFWQVAAVDASGNAGETAGPHTVEVITRTPASR